MLITYNVLPKDELQLIVESKILVMRFLWCVLSAVVPLLLSCLFVCCVVGCQCRPVPVTDHTVPGPRVSCLSVPPTGVLQTAVMGILCDVDAKHYSCGTVALEYGSSGKLISLVS